MSQQRNFGGDAADITSVAAAAAAGSSGGGDCNLDVKRVSELFGSARMRQYWLDTFPTDFTIIFEPTDDDDNNTTKATTAKKARKFEVHSHVLKKCDVFKTMLENDRNFKEGQDKQLTLRACKSVVIEKFIEFLYEDDLSDDKQLNDRAAMQDLIVLADQYMMQPLKEFCGTKLQRLLAPLSQHYTHIANRDLQSAINAAPVDRPRVEKGLDVLQLAINYDVKTLKLAAQSNFASWAPLIQTQELQYWLRTADYLTPVADACARELASRLPYLSKEKVFELWVLAYDISNKALFDAASKQFLQTWSDLQLSSASPLSSSSLAQWRVFRALAKQFAPVQHNSQQVEPSGTAVVAAKK